MLLSLVNSALTLALFAAFFWALDTLNQLRREQAELRAQIDRIIEALGLPLRAERAVVRCEQCGAYYLTSLAECYRCGCPKRANAIAITPPQSSPNTVRATDSARRGG